MNRKNVRDSISYFSNGKLVEENIESGYILVWLYSSWLGKLVRWIFARQWFCNLVGRYYKSRLSRSKIKLFIEKHKIVMSDFVQPLGGFATFNDFFIRKLKNGVRDIDRSRTSCVSPADSKVLAYQKVHETMLFCVKTLPFSLVQFLGGRQHAESYFGGSMLIFRLAPYDYHRFHFPLDGRVQKPRIIMGGYHSVNPLVYEKEIQPITSNRRVIIPIFTEKFGQVLMVPVGALFVGSIVLTYQHDSVVRKGDEAGYFEFGGSTVVLLFEPTRVNIEKVFIDHTQKGFETSVQVGQLVAQGNFD